MLIKPLFALFMLAGPVCLLAPVGFSQGADDCTNATPLAGFGTFAFDNTNATGGGPADCSGIGTRKDVWFRWTAPASGDTRFETCATTTGFDTRIVAYDGADCVNLTFLGCAANTCLGLSRMNFNAIAGEEYLLRVGSRMLGTGGPGFFRVEAEPCPATSDDRLEDNDVCTEAVALTDGSYSDLWCAKGDDDWYELCVPGGGTLTVDTLFATTDGDIDIYLYDGCTTGAFFLGLGGSATDDEEVIFINTSVAPITAYLRVELWESDPTQDCNDYTLMISGADGGCRASSVGVNYCAPVVNSTGSPAIIFGVGSRAVADNDLTLGAVQLPANATSFFITSQTQGSVMNPGGRVGTLCVLGSVGRYVGSGQIQQASTDGTISLPVNLTQTPQRMGFVSVVAGETWNFQAWYTDSNPTGPTSNFTDGLAITFL